MVNLPLNDPTEDALVDSSKVIWRCLKLVWTGFLNYFLSAPFGWVLISSGVVAIIVGLLQPTTVLFHLAVIGLTYGFMRAFRKTPKFEQLAIKKEFKKSFRVEYYTYNGTRSQAQAWMGLVVTWAILILTVAAFLSLYGIWLYLVINGEVKL